MRIVWSRRALRHLRRLRSYVAQDNPDAAARVAEKLLAAVEPLAVHPDLGRPGRVVGTGGLVVPDTPYVIPYRVRGARLELIAVFHGRQKWPAHL